VCCQIIDTQRLTKEYNYKFVAVTSQTIQIEVLEENTVSEVLPRTLLSSEEFYCCYIKLMFIWPICTVCASRPWLLPWLHTHVHTRVHVCVCVCVCNILYILLFCYWTPVWQNFLAESCGCSASLEFPYLLCNHDILLSYSQKLMNWPEPNETGPQFLMLLSKIHFNITIFFIPCLSDWIIHRHWFMLFYDYSFFYVNLRETLFVAGVYFCRMWSFQHFHWHCHFFFFYWRMILQLMFIEEGLGVSTVIW
jgi:hypothetical protein